MKKTDKNFKTKNLRNILLSATVGMIPCLFLQDEKFILYGGLYLYVVFPLLVIIFGSTIKAFKTQKVINVSGRLYPKTYLKKAPIYIFVVIFFSIFIPLFFDFIITRFLPSNLIVCLPFLTYHAFCAVYSHPLSILKSFFLLKFSQQGYVHNNSSFPNSQSLHSTGFSSHAVSSQFSFHETYSPSKSFVENHWNSPSYSNFQDTHHHTSYDFSSSSNIDINDLSSPYGYYNNPISPGYWDK